MEKFFEGMSNETKITLVTLLNLKEFNMIRLNRFVKRL